MPDSDQELITAFLAGEQDAVDQLQGWLEQACRLYRERLGWQWEDLQQDLLLEVTRLLTSGSFKGRSRLRTYLWRVASNACLNRLRNERRARTCSIETVADTLECGSVSALDQVLANESNDILARLLARTSKECRQLWHLLLRGKSYQEMSHDLGASPGALRVRVLRCRRRALELWQEMTRWS